MRREQFAKFQPQKNELHPCHGIVCGPVASSMQLGPLLKTGFGFAPVILAALEMRMSLITRHQGHMASSFLPNGSIR